MPETTHTYIEDALDASPFEVDPDVVLDDHELRAGGLVPVRTWTRTRASGNAQRARRSRQKAAKGEGGAARKQLSLLAPPDEDTRAALREVGKRLVAGEVSTDEIRSLGHPSTHYYRYDPAAQLGRRALKIINSGGFRGRLLRLLLGSQAAS